MYIYCAYFKCTLNDTCTYHRNGEEAGMLMVCLCPSSEVRMPSLSAILVTFDNTAAKVKINKEINPTGNQKIEC